MQSPTVPASPLPYPRLTLFKGDTPIAAASAWGLQPNTAAIAAAAKSTGAFALPSDSADAAMLLPLDGSNYTLQVTGDNGSTGVALVEVYEAP